jgi:assimilatory nitrate reductase catalytic subunit
MGVNQSHEGVRVAQAIIALALLTGTSAARHRRELDHRPVQRDGLAPVQQHDQPVRRPRLRERCRPRRSGAASSASRSERIPDRSGWAYDQIVEGIRSGAIRGLWIAGTNGAHSWIDQSDFRALLGELDFLCVQDLYADTETARCAHLVLPAAGWGEKDGTFINSERRIGS